MKKKLLEFLVTFKPGLSQLLSMVYESNKI